MKRLIYTVFAMFIASSALLAADFTGSYKTNWGVVKLQQKGDRVTGSYTGPFNGDIEGTVDGGQLHYRWIQPNGQWGKGVFTLVGDKIDGTWGAGISAENGGRWFGDRQNSL